jgi:hypothetical protein
MSREGGEAASRGGRKKVKKCPACKKSLSIGECKEGHRLKQEHYNLVDWVGSKLKDGTKSRRLCCRHFEFCPKGSKSEEKRLRLLCPRGSLRQVGPKARASPFDKQEERKRKKKAEEKERKKARAQEKKEQQQKEVETIVKKLCTPSFTRESNQQLQPLRRETRARTAQQGSNEVLQAFVVDATQRLNIEPMIVAISNAVKSGTVNQEQLVGYLASIQEGVKGVLQFTLRSSFFRGTLKADTGCTLDEIHALLECVGRFFHEEAKKSVSLKLRFVHFEQRILWTLYMLNTGCSFESLFQKVEGYWNDIKDFRKLIKRTAKYLAQALEYAAPIEWAVKLPSLEAWRGDNEACAGMDFFKKFDHSHGKTIYCLTLFADGTGLPVQRAASARLGRLFWTDYKKHHSCRYFVMTTPRGRIVYVSPLFPGKIDDRVAFEKCNLNVKLQEVAEGLLSHLKEQADLASTTLCGAQSELDGENLDGDTIEDRRSLCDSLRRLLSLARRLSE